MSPPGSAKGETLSALREGSRAPVPAWLVRRQSEAEQPPRQARVPLLYRDAVIGSVEPLFLQSLADLRRVDGAPLLEREGVGAPTAWQLRGELDAGLAQLAQALRATGQTGAWRNERLAVRDPSGAVLGRVERALVRVLGIRTQAVHLSVATPDGRIWVQQRALDKPNDPGLWDTLMGGMVSAEDDLQAALARETMEEAGLALTQLQGLCQGGAVSVRGPHADGGGAGYVEETIVWFTATLPKGIEPENQDGEVAQFELLDRASLLARLERDEFTLEASLVLAALLGFHT